MWTPELKDEVLVAFIHGDMRHPIVLGGLYNGIDKPPTFKANNKDEKMLRTKAGHEIRFIDTPAKSESLSSTRAKSFTSKSTASRTRSLFAPRVEKLNLASDQITIKADSSLKIEANTIEATAAGDMTLKGTTINLN